MRIESECLADLVAHMCGMVEEEGYLFEFWY